ncbi:glycosyltransferase family 4 protein [Umezawaea tangerina]|uniref:D-inositol-3-phosphate glycosyltransferase n=1 Tax=Umezawaea tangerina TaxID=84725 RepID=A0A2T0SWK5_9PSEU|nr:glycosyltransferase family 4 protein [Umezawaea tangerina]PRY37795.1 D-inositol-3-phosphate glycosyltransferase [Umezawaea tangerina]
MVGDLLDHPVPAVFSLFCEAVSDLLAVEGNRPPVTAALRGALLTTRDAQVVSWLLDTSALHGLTPLDADEARAVGARQSLWRYLDALGVAVDEDPESPYEKLLLDLLRDGVALPVAPRVDGPTVAQSMLIGGTARPGEGASGGLGVFLRSLGDALADRADIGRVVTVVLDTDPTAIAVAGQDDREHWTVHVPVDSPVALTQAEMGRHRAAITWWTVRLLRRCGLTPDVVHVRYSDDGSLAMAEAARHLGARVVFTLTPDPHRHLAERYAAGTADTDALRFDLHRVHLGDLLVDRADTVVSIGGRSDELRDHFPQLETRTAVAIEEGISPLRPLPHRPEALVGELFRPSRSLPRLDDSARGVPVLLNVGRLHPVKQQGVLVRAWLSRHLYRSTALVLIGGSVAGRTPDEQAVLDEVLALAEAVPRARGRLAVLPAWPNTEVRQLEHALAEHLPAPAPHVYACGSLKEEFGIAVLEAMEAGLLVVGPRRGGLPHYVEHGRNGFLVDTSSAESLGEGLAEVVALGAATAPAAAAGRETVRTRFGIDRVADSFAEVYR